MDGYLHEDDRLFEQLAYGTPFEEKCVVINIACLKHSLRRIELAEDAYLSGFNISSIMLYYAKHGQFAKIPEDKVNSRIISIGIYREAHGLPMDEKAFKDMFAEYAKETPYLYDKLQRDNFAHKLTKLIKYKGIAKLPIIMAARCDHFEAFKMLYENQKDMTNKATMFCAAILGKSERIKQFLRGDNFFITDFPEIAAEVFVDDFPVMGRFDKEIEIFLTKMQRAYFPNEWAAYYGKILDYKCSPLIYIYAIFGNQLKVLKWLKHNEQRPLFWHDNILNTHFKHKHICAKFCSSSSDLIGVALRWGSFRILKWLVKTYDVKNISIYYGDIHLTRQVVEKLEFLLQQGLITHKDMFYIAVFNENIKMCEKYLQYAPTNKSLFMDFKNVEMLELVMNRCRGEHTIVTDAASCPRVFQFLHQRSIFTLDSIFSHCVFSEKIQVLQWLKEIGYKPKNTEYIDLIKINKFTACARFFECYALKAP